ncbi:hypothetical protein GmHk_18G052788 [Glycine max]|nr:hypothetical protein GmHk_18G052788 [Glycine max]
MLLSRGDIPSVSTMFAKLQHFYRVSGFSISSDKYAIYSTGIRPHIQQLTGFSLERFSMGSVSSPLLCKKTAFLNKGSLCPLCSNEAESNAHLFFSYRKSVQRITDFLIRGRSTSDVQEKFRCLVIAITVYYIWLSRNKLIFEDYQFSVIEVISIIKFLMYRQTPLMHLF